MSRTGNAALRLFAVALTLGCGDSPLSPGATPLTPPTALAARELVAGDIELTWQDNSDNEVRFELVRSPVGPNGPYAALASVDAGVSSYRDAQVDGVSEYCYEVRAVGPAGTAPSAFTPAVCHRSVPPPAPSQPAATATFAQVDFSWSDNSDNETAFEVWRSTGGVNGTFVLDASVAPDVTSYSGTGLQDDTEYCYRVRAIGPKGQPSPFSSAACATTPVPALPPPAAPTDLTTAVSGAMRISLDWTDNASDESGFEVWRSTSGPSGTYGLLTGVAANVTSVDDPGLAAGAEYCYRVRATGAGFAPPSSFTSASCATTALIPLVVRIVLFGDSNTDRCEEVQPPNRKSSYVSVTPRLGPDDPHLACSLAGKVEAAWQGARSETIRVVNHAIASSTTGGGGFGGPDRTNQGAPNARTVVDGTTRYAAEVLGEGYPWSGGEPTNSAFPTGPVARVNAYVPGANDFAYVSMGTNDDAGPTRTLTAAETAANLRWMIGQWTAAGRAADHFILTTLAPRDDANSATSIAERNDLIGALAAELGVHLVDLAAHTSDDGGATWRTASLHIGDGIHYTEAVRAWLGDQVAAHLAATVPAGP